MQADPRGYGGRWDSHDFLAPIYTSPTPVRFNYTIVAFSVIVTFLFRGMPSLLWLDSGMGYQLIGAGPVRFREAAGL